jgi:protein-tyrosine phosphatase
MTTVLFLCTGNYYRSRFAEVLFNHLAREQGVRARAISRGLRIDLSSTLPGVVSPHTVEAMQRRKITCGSITRKPATLTFGDLKSAHVIVALKEAEHRAMLDDSFPGWSARTVFWHVHDVDMAHPDVAITQIEQLVRELLKNLPSVAGVSA